MGKKYNDTVVVVPFHKVSPSEYELLSLIRCSIILQDYQMVIVAPKNMDLSNYHKLKFAFEIELFEEEWFVGIQGYNKLMLSTQFYSRFSHYRYMLVFQLDGIIFKNDLKEWVMQGYDYIGAPWLEYTFMAFLHIARKVSFWYALKLLLQGKFRNHVGNGGVSLRKIETFIQAINEGIDLLRKWNGNEDYFWSYCATVNGKTIKKPPKKEAIRFAVETAPQVAFKVLGNDLPMFVHAWEKHDTIFWARLLYSLHYFEETKLLYEKSRGFGAEKDIEHEIL